MAFRQTGLCVCGGGGGFASVFSLLGGMLRSSQHRCVEVWRLSLVTQWASISGAFSMSVPSSVANAALNVSMQMGGVELSLCVSWWSPNGNGLFFSLSLPPTQHTVAKEKQGMCVYLSVCLCAPLCVFASVCLACRPCMWVGVCVCNGKMRSKTCVHRCVCFRSALLGDGQGDDLCALGETEVVGSRRTWQEPQKLHVHEAMRSPKLPLPFRCSCLMWSSIHHFTFVLRHPYLSAWKPMTLTPTHTSQTSRVCHLD